MILQGLGAVATGAVLGAIGLVFATDFRGVTERHTRRTLASVSSVERVVRRVPPWRWLLRGDVEDRVVSSVRVAKRQGMLFAAIGLGLVVAGVLNVIAGAIGVGD